MVKDLTYQHNNEETGASGAQGLQPEVPPALLQSLGWRTSWSCCLVQGFKVSLSITAAAVASQVLRRGIDGWPPLFRVAANGKAAITDTASIGESTGSQAGAMMR